MSSMCRKSVSQLGEILGSATESSIESLCHFSRLRNNLELLFANPIHSKNSLYLKIMQLCTDAKADKQGRSVHSHLLTTGFPLNVHLNTGLVMFYSKVNDMITARNVFDEMPERNVVSWTALLSGYAQNGHCDEALMVFSTMHRAGVKANQFTYGSVLRACTSIMCLETGKQIQGCIQKGRFVENLFVQSALVDFHSKCGKMEDACYVFDLMSERDVVSWNAMIGGYSVQGFDDDSFLMFRSMLREGMVPDCFTFGNVLKSSRHDSDLMKVCQIHGFLIRLGLDFHNHRAGSLINAYIKCGSVRIASHIYKSMPKKDRVSCTALITGFAREGKINNTHFALDLFNEVHQMPRGIDDVIICSMLNICANTTSLSLGRQLHAIALKYQANNDIPMSNALIDMYSKSGEIDDANRIFDEMQGRNIISWTSLIAGYGKNGCGPKAISLYKKMECEGLKPNDITFLSLLFACSHSGLISEGWNCFNNMVQKYNILPRAEHYACIVDLFARNGQLEEAYNLMGGMEVKPNASLWGAVLGACSVYGYISLGEIAAKQVLDIEPNNYINYVVLASMYSSVGSWDNAWQIRKQLENKSLTKDPGFSFIESGNKSVVETQRA